MRPWALAGFSGSGKSTIAPLVAAAAGRRALDLDELLGAGRIAALVAAGEEALREAEAGLLEEILLGPRDVVVALGGGALEGARSREILAAGFVIAWLDVPLDACLERCARQDRVSRPILEAARRMGPEEVERFHRRRARAARLAHVRVDASAAPAEVARELLQRLQDASESMESGASAPT